MTKPKARTASLALALAGLVAIEVGCASVRQSSRGGAPEKVSFATLRPGSLPAFREAFNEHDHEVRLLVMLSPT